MCRHNFVNAQPYYGKVQTQQCTAIYCMYSYHVMWGNTTFIGLELAYSQRLFLTVNHAVAMVTSLTHCFYSIFKQVILQIYFANLQQIFNVKMSNLSPVIVLRTVNCYINYDYGTNTVVIQCQTSAANLHINRQAW